MASDDPADNGAVPEWVRGVRTVTVLTGAGISTDSGIPDFRGPLSGLHNQTNAPPTYQAYVSDVGVRRKSWRTRVTHPAWKAKPNVAHRALLDLSKSVETWVITQNIDGLHHKSGVPADRVLELHGTMFRTVCVGCGDQRPMADVLVRVEAGEDDPACEICGGILKSATVMFGETLDSDVFTRAVKVAGGCDLLLAVGSTLVVEPAASLCKIAVTVGAALVIVNRDPTPYDRMATAVIREPIGVALPRITAQIIRANQP